ncbi:c-type cytochrome biogenesis protein CcmI [Pseudomonas sp. FIP_A4]|jgi:cytochrome c-type biogenesis protein CcmH|uniref:c-type cytochrome biogenesis protein CcmI n=1 Tax=Pseudomonas sp. FIP_A4 TaxID=3070684 RepID=UPI0009897CC7|nr:c-type cytochrome biogenesis protein CcmI [Pseudomonadaceae bacterium]OOE11385.1 c-type cytochrome biogenesis protein CcmI [Stutzerimonas degradans]
MIDFWIAAGVLLLVALAFLLLPILRGRKAQAEEDRTALNVALYQERLAELAAQRAAGTLTEEQLEAGRADAARELLDDTEGSDATRSARLGRAVPLLAALLVPLLGYGLYLHWGASDKVELARQFGEQPRSLEEMTLRLERAVEAQPDSAEGWYFLGRTYMNQERPADAAKAFARVIELAGRQPELLGQWAQAQYFAGNRQWTKELQALTDEALRADPQEVTSLGLLGIAAYEEGRFQDAIGFWERLVATLPEEDPSREAIKGGIARAREQLGETAPAPAAASESAAVRLQIEVTLDPSLQDDVRPDDSVFVFARAVSGPAIPLAAKRLRVADLPANISLGDADAMMPQLKMSNYPEVKLVARISREGNATKGEWAGQSEALKTAGGDKTIRLMIDKPDAP